jgi:hypothetical protein
MASKLFVVDSFRRDIMDGTIDLNTDTLMLALVDSSPTPSYSAWQDGHSYSLGNIVIPTTRNGHRYRCTTAGASHSSEPSWPTTDGGTVSDNAAAWEEYGGELADVDVWADVSSGEVETGDGYTTDGVELTGGAVTFSGDEGKFDANDATWTELTKTMRYAFLYKDGTANERVDPVIAYILLDTTPDDVSVTGVDFTIAWNSAGIMVLN